MKNSSITIPPEALEAGCSAYTAVIYRGNGTQAEFREAIRAAFLAIVEAWPGMGISPIPHWLGPNQEVTQVLSIILPLPTENSDE